MLRSRSKSEPIHKKRVKVYNLKLLTLNHHLNDTIIILIVIYGMVANSNKII